MTTRGTIRVSHATDLVAEIANELETWPDVRIERGSGSGALVRYRDVELGALDPDRGVVELPVPHLEHDELVEHGDAEPADDSTQSRRGSATRSRGRRM